MTKVEPNLGTPERDPIHDMRALFSANEADRFELHSRHLNNMMVRVLKTIGFDVRFVSGKGAYLAGCLGRALPRPAERLWACSRSGATIRAWRRR